MNLKEEEEEDDNKLFKVITRLKHSVREPLTDEENSLLLCCRPGVSHQYHQREHPSDG